jgi:hypothetical protein
LIVHGMLDLSPLWSQNLQSRPYSNILNFNYPIHYHFTVLLIIFLEQIDFQRQ